ncbi:hypothetical protein Q7P37_002054 [Cladosporium fusiforme]
MAGQGIFTDQDVNMAVRYSPDTDAVAWDYGAQAIEDFFGPEAPFWCDDPTFHDLQPAPTYGGEGTSVSYGEPVTGPQIGSQYPLPQSLHTTPIAPSMAVLQPSTPYIRGRHTQSTEGAASLMREMQQQQNAFNSMKINPVPFPILGNHPAAGDVHEAMELVNAGAQTSRKRRLDSENNDGIAQPFFPGQGYINIPYDEEDTVIPTPENGLKRIATHVQIPKLLPEPASDSYTDFNNPGLTQNHDSVMSDPSSGPSKLMQANTKKKRSAPIPQSSLLSSDSAASHMISDTAPADTAATDATSEPDAIVRTKRKCRYNGHNAISKYESEALMLNQRDILTPDDAKKVGRRTTRSTMELGELLATGPNAGQAAKKRHAKK